ncbi:unnamed protein product [Polarella glacialis]|uniref:FAS1 domain-containing protein n=1 Tax=Polarella glacialis TaxID=89957 RepID=A0A813J372_POLGL|nr:unnamed protein product [Polarella glacialis]
MALQSAPGSVFVLANSAPSAFRGSALATAATVGLAPAALADASAPSSVNLVGLAAVGATLAAAASTRRQGQKVARNFFGGDSTPARPSFEVSQQSGIQEPIGFFDPLGLSADNDEATFKRRRTVEIKHGRVAMFVPLLGWFQILWFAGLIEGSGFFSGKYGLGFMKDTTMDGEPGNYGAGFPTFLGKVEDPEVARNFFGGDSTPARPSFEVSQQSGIQVARNFFGGDSAPARPSFEVSQQSGIQEPIGSGFFSGRYGLGLMKDTTMDGEPGNYGAGFPTFLGKVSDPEVARNFFGGDSTPARPSFEVSQQSGIQVPLLGWFQILWFAGLVEGSGFFSGKYGLGLMKDTTMDGEPGNYGAGFPTFLGKVSDPEARKTKLAAELANGRLAMMAIIGMFFQDGLTGSAWGDWSLYTASPLRAAGSFAGYQAPQVEKSGRAAVVARRAENIAATAIANGNFTILVKALQKAGLVETMSGETPYTVFAPTDAAFADLLKELGVTAEQLLANPDLKSILLYHVAGGTTMSSSLKDGMRVTSAQGGQLAVQIGGGNVKVGRATVTSADVACSNGVIHVIDKVLLPPAAPAAPFDPAKQIGAMAPLGFFDPLGFSKKGDKAGFNNLQASEIKHGRVAMMAALGAVVQHYVKFPGFESVPSGLGAVTTAPGTYGFAALFLVSGALELAIWTQDEKKEPGNFGDPAGLNMYNPEMREKEINNGRIGMFSAIGIIAAEALSGKDGMNQLGF